MTLVALPRDLRDPTPIVRSGIPEFPERAVVGVQNGRRLINAVNLDVFQFSDFGNGVAAEKDMITHWL